MILLSYPPAALAATPLDTGKGKQGGKGRKQKQEEEDGFFSLDDYGEQVGVASKPGGLEGNAC